MSETGRLSWWRTSSNIFQTCRPRAPRCRPSLPSQNPGQWTQHRKQKSVFMFNNLQHQHANIPNIIQSKLNFKWSYCLWSDSRCSRCSRCYLVQGAHGEHGAIVGFDGLDERRVSPDVNVSVGGPRENQVLRSSITCWHHRLLLPQVPKNSPFKRQTATCRRRAGRLILMGTWLSAPGGFKATVNTSYSWLQDVA